MCAQELKTQRSQLVSTLAGGTAENFESILDYLLSWDVLTWEDYEHVSIREHGLSRLARQLLDILGSKGERGYELLVAALEEVGKGPQPTEACSPKEEELSKALQYLQTNRPLIVRIIHGHLESTLQCLLDANFITRYDRDELQLPVYTHSQQARRLLTVLKAKGNEAACCLLQHIQGLQVRSAVLHFGDACKKYQKKLKSTVSAQSRFLNTYDGADNVCLEFVYTDSVLELVKTTGASGPAQPCNSIVELTNLFRAHESLNKDADTILISGEAGSGKSTLLQQMHNMWATGKAFHTFAFIFPFSCRQLCCVEKAVSLKTLLFEHCCWPDSDQDEIFQFILNNPQEILLTFDGFDEFKFAFSDEDRHCSPTDPTSIHRILCNLIQGNLMKGTSKVVTSRPAAISAEFRKYIQKEVCVKGFSRAGIEMFMKKNHSDLSISQPIIDLLNTNSSLRGLCHVPVFCWIVSKCHQELIRSGSVSPRTMTDIYLLTLRHFLLHTIPTKDRTGNILCNKFNTIYHLGKLALSGLGNCCYVFTAHQLGETEVSKDDISSGFLVLSRTLAQDSLTRSQHYEFIHITFQCFFVALYLAMNENLSSKAMRCLFTQTGKKGGCCLISGCSPKCSKPTHQEERTTVAMLHQAERSNLELTASFLAGLFAKGHCEILVESWNPQKLPKKQKVFKQCLPKVIWKHLKSIPPAVHGERKSTHAMPEFVWLIKCIHEMQDELLAKEVVSRFKVEHLKLTYCGIGPSECTALAFMLKHLKNPIGLQLDHNSVGDIGIEQLLPCLHLCHSLYLRDNNISDKGIRRLIDQALHWQNFQKIALFNNKLTDECAHSFAKLLKQKQNFLSLRLGNNYITPEGGEVLAEGVKQSKSLQFLGMWGNSIGDNGACALAEALHGNKSLIWLSLVGNNIGNVGAQALAAMIETNPALEELWLSNNEITQDGVSALVTAIVHNTTIKSIWLRGNSLTPEETEVFASLDVRLLL